ncbi:hypothetical protein HIM_00986 [Hirsutella minnesotensis 3608]|nr:hypothetical protein HIM_00986 [Hirsutella minnesotensis 3608]
MRLSAFCSAAASWVLLPNLALTQQPPTDSALRASLNRTGTFRAAQTQGGLIDKVVVDINGGKITGKSLLNVESFIGIPFAQPPVGDLRLKPPQRLQKELGDFDGTKIAPACPQFILDKKPENPIIEQVFDTITQLPIFNVLNEQEDCLTIDVYRPAGTKAGDKLPVLYWIFGGGFEFGSTNTYDPTLILHDGMDSNQKFLFVAVNYRSGGFGFMPGKEMLQDGSGNIGLLDQRLGLEWVSDNIDRFGGDPSKVTIWGESAGSVSVFSQIVLNGGNATYRGKELFRGAIMNSGSATPAEPLDSKKGQQIYDTVVNAAGCANGGDTLDCLRKLPFQKFFDATRAVPPIYSFSSLALSYLPRPDGKSIEDSTDLMLEKGKYHHCPVILGGVEDEGSQFGFFTDNITTADNFVDYLSTIYFPRAPKEKLKEFVNLYEPSLEKGSPFRTGALNELYPGFKRLTAVLGDLVFALARRFTLKTFTRVHPEIPVWSYMASDWHDVPFLGTFHASDVVSLLFDPLPSPTVKKWRAHYINFVCNQDPNKGKTDLPQWPQWKENGTQMWYQTSSDTSFINDTYRFEAENKDVTGAIWRDFFCFKALLATRRLLEEEFNGSWFVQQENRQPGLPWVL